MTRSSFWSQPIGKGFGIGVQNERGAQERDLATEYPDRAKQRAFDYPDVSGVLESIVGDYDGMTEWWDAEAEIEKRRNSWSVWQPQSQPVSHGTVSPYERKQSHRSLLPPCVLINYQRKQAESTGGPLTREPHVHGKWSQLGVPHRGWTCVLVDDLGDLGSICEMCEVQEIRYVHHMQHPNYPDELAGC